MFDHDAAVDDDIQSRSSSNGGCLFMGSVKLHPYASGACADGLLDDGRDEFRPAEDIDNIDRRADGKKIGVGSFSENGGNRWVDGVDPVAVVLEVECDAMAVALWPGRESNDGDGRGIAKARCNRGIVLKDGHG